MTTDEDGTQHETYQGFYVRTQDDSIIGSIREIPDKRFSLPNFDIQAAAFVLAEEILYWANSTRLGELPEALPFDTSHTDGFARIDVDPQSGVAVTYKPACWLPVHLTGTPFRKMAVESEMVCQTEKASYNGHLQPARD